MPQSFASAHTSATSLASMAAEEEHENECSVCMAESSNAICVPCGHTVMCRGCALACKAKGHTDCPVCRSQLTGWLVHSEGGAMEQISLA